MKKLFFTLFAIGAVFAFTACGSDDPDPIKTEKFFNGTCQQVIDLKGFKDQPTTSLVVSATVDAMLKDTPSYGTPITAGVLNLTENTTVRVIGLKPGVVLNDLKLIINDQERNFGNISNEDANTNLYTTDSFEYFKSVFAKMITDGKLSVKATFTPTADLVEADGVKIQVTFYGRFSYWVTQQ